MANKRALKLVKSHITVHPDGALSLYLNQERVEQLIRYLEGTKRHPIDSSIPAPDDAFPKVYRPDYLFSAMVKAEGVACKDITPMAARRIGRAIKEIKQASPDVTPDEILNRAARYRRAWPEITFSAQALAVNWHKFAEDQTDPGVPSYHQV